SVELLRVLHERNTVANDSVCYDAHRIFDLPRFSQCLVKFVVVVAIYFNYIPPVGQIVLNNILRHDFFYVTAYLDMVVVYYSRNIRQSKLLCKASRLSDLAFLLFPITHENIDMTVLP